MGKTFRKGDNWTNKFKNKIHKDKTKLKQKRRLRKIVNPDIKIDISEEEFLDV